MNKDVVDLHIIMPRCMARQTNHDPARFRALHYLPASLRNENCPLWSPLIGTNIPKRRSNRGKTQ